MIETVGALVAVGAVIGATIVGSIAAWKWGESRQTAAAGQAEFWGELEKWLPWVLVAITAIVAVAVVFLMTRKAPVQPLVTVLKG